MEIWKEGKIGDFADVKGGKRLPKGKQLVGFPTAHPYIRIRDMGKSKFLQLTSDYEYVDEETQKYISRYIVSKGDILISVVGTIGLVGIIGDTLDGANQTENCDKLTNIRNIDRDFLYYYLVSSFGQGEIAKGTVGAVQPKLPLKNIQDLSIRFPSLQTQKRISAVLSALDNRIEKNVEINKNLEQQAKAIFERMLSSSNSQSCALSDIAQLNPKRSLSKGSVARYIDMAQLSTSTSFPNGWDYKTYNGGMRFCNGDTILARITPCLENGKTAFINFLNKGEVAFGSTEYVIISPKDDYPPEFFYCLARYTDFVDYAVKNMNGSSGRQRVSAETIGKYILPKITDSEIKDFCAVVPPMFKVCCNNSLENIRLAALRDTLLPRLMSGDLDVTDLNF